MSDQDFRFSEVGHRYLEYANPMSIAKIHASIALMGQYKPRHILDIGAGNLYLLDQFVSTLDCDGTALELPGVTSDEAKQRYGKKITLIETDAQEYFESLSSHPFDAAICMGATHALGGFKDCLRTLQKHLPPASMIILGEGYWKQKPSAAYIEAIGGREDELMLHHENLQYIESLHMTPLWFSAASLDDWDHYEWQYSRAIEDFVQQNPTHPQSDAFHAKIKHWRNAVWKWGRDTMGFGIYAVRT